jgi:hypothetical protein
MAAHGKPINGIETAHGYSPTFGKINLKTLSKGQLLSLVVDANPLRQQQIDNQSFIKALRCAP